MKYHVEILCYDKKKLLKKGIHKFLRGMCFRLNKINIYSLLLYNI